MDYRHILGLAAGVAVMIQTALILKGIYLRSKVAGVVLTLTVGTGVTVAVIVLITAR